MRHAVEGPARPALTFLRDDGQTESLTYAQLGKAVLAASARIAEQTKQDERALLLFPTGLDFAVAFLGCLQAGVTAVPLNLPSKFRPGGRTASVMRKARANLVLTNNGSVTTVRAHCQGAGIASNILAVDSRGDTEGVEDSARPRSRVAFIQYTSGSTAEPKGVMISQENLACNLGQIIRSFEHDRNTVVVSWLPQFHDMGLVGSLLSTLASGGHLVFFTPAAFLQRPMRWLTAISEFRGTCAGGPNFGWELCARYADLAPDDLDLTSLHVAFVGAEPVRHETLERFARSFSRFGFDKRMFLPCYGLAEGTLFISGGPTLELPASLALRREELESGTVAPADTSMPSISVVSSGRIADGVTVRIADPETREAAREGKIGEIWLAGRNITEGYFEADDPDEALATDGQQRFLRTGDLGFVAGNELFVTGRLKDLIILRGRNLYPQDVEAAVEAAIDFAKPNSCIAFGLDAGQDGESLVIALETDRHVARALRAESENPSQTDQYMTIANAVRAAVMSACEARVEHVILVRPGSLPRTSSGKVQRRRCRQLQQSGQLEVIAGGPSRDQTMHLQPDLKSPRSAAQRSETISGLLTWFRRFVEKQDFRLMDERRSPAPQIILELGNRGFFGWQISKCHGGLELSTCELLPLIEQIAAADVSLALLVGIHNCLGLRTLTEFAGSDFKREWLPDFAKGRRFCAFALSETAAGSNPAAIKTEARRVQNGFVVTGEKRWIGLASWAALVTVFAKAVDLDGSPLGIVALAVPTDADGFEQGPEARTLGARTVVQNRIKLQNVFVPDKHVLGRVGEGMSVAQDAMMFSRFCLAGVSIGVMKRSAQMMQRFASRRTIATGRLSENGVTIGRLADLVCSIEALSALTAEVGKQIEQDGRPPVIGSLCCKILGPELACQTTDSLVQLLGGRGYEESSPAAQMHRDARLLRIFEGATEALIANLGSMTLRETHRVADYIARKFRSPRLAEAFTSAVELSRSNVGEMGALSGLARQHWHMHLAGHFAAETCLLAAVECRGTEGATRTWANDRFTQARERLFHPIAPGLSQDLASIRGGIQGYADTIGDLDLRARGEEWSTDELLALEGRSVCEATSGTAVSTLPASTSDLPHKEDIRAVILKWAKEHNASCGSSLDDDMPLEALGVDSLGATEISLELERTIGMAPPIEVVLEHNTLAKLAYWCAQRAARNRTQAFQNGGS